MYNVQVRMQWIKQASLYNAPPPGYALSEKALLSDQKNAVQPENNDNTKQNKNSQQFLVLPEGDE